MKYVYHAAANLFPLMEGSDFVRLCHDIRENGLKLPIIQHPDGSILDGRNRLRACEEMGIRPVLVRWEGKPGREIDYVLSLNLSRRHLDTSQRAMVAAKLATMKAGGDRQSVKSIAAFAAMVQSQATAADTLHVSRGSVQRARVVIDEGTPEQIAAVEHGETTVSAALRKIRGEHNTAKAKAEAEEDASGPLAEIERLREWGDANAQTAKELLAENETLQKVMDADDKLASALAQNKVLRGHAKVLQSLLDGEMNKNVELTKIIKSRDRQIERLKKIEKLHEACK